MSAMKYYSFGIVLTLVLAACNTVDGVGEDVSATGAAISDTAADVKSNLN